MKRIILFVNLLLIAASLSARDRALEKQIRAAVGDKRATVAVAVRHEGKTVASVNGKIGLPTMSVCKFPLAIAVLDRLSRHGISPDSLVAFGKAQLSENTYSPLRDSIPQGGELPVRELIRYALVESDNNACDILFGMIGSPAVVDRYIRSRGISGVAIAATEQTMHERFENQYLNRTTAEAAVRLLELFDRGCLLPDNEKKFVENAMIATRTGRNRIRRALPDGIVAGDKTGSSLRSGDGMTAADNDLAFVRLPDSTTYYIAVLVAESYEDDRSNDATIAGISAIVYDHMARKSMKN